MTTHQVVIAGALGKWMALAARIRQIVAALPGAVAITLLFLL